MPDGGPREKVRRCERVNRARFGPRSSGLRRVARERWRKRWRGSGGGRVQSRSRRALLVASATKRTAPSRRLIDSARRVARLRALRRASASFRVGSRARGVLRMLTRTRAHPWEKGRKAVLYDRLLRVSLLRSRRARSPKIQSPSADSAGRRITLEVRRSRPQAQKRGSAPPWTMPQGGRLESSRARKEGVECDVNPVGERAHSCGVSQITAAKREDGRMFA